MRGWETVRNKKSPSDAYDTERWVRAAAGPTYATHVNYVVPKTTLLLVPIPGLVAVGARSLTQLMPRLPLRRLRVRCRWRLVAPGAGPLQLVPPLLAFC